MSRFAVTGRRLIVATALVALCLTLFAASASARSRGGLSPSGNSAPSVPGAVASLVRGRAIAPADAPPAVAAAIRAANSIRARPYLWGGGHGRWWSRGYDCSGAVSFALHGGGLLDIPLDSGSMMSWGEAGRGTWITVYANRGHAFAEIAGLRWDTSGNRRGVSGPRWHLARAATAGYVARHPSGY